MLHVLSSQERKRFWLIGLLVVLLVGLWVLFSPRGLVRYYRLRGEIEAMRAEKEALTTSNKALAAEIAKLEKNPVYLEGVAREEYGLIRKNEMVFEFPKPPKRHH